MNKQLMKQLMSELIVSKPVINKCNNCGKNTWWPKIDNGKFLNMKRYICETCMELAEEAKKKAEEDLLAQHKNYVQREMHNIGIFRGMPAIYNGVSKDDFTNEQQAILKIILNDLCAKKYESTFYMFFGQTGRGKSHMAAYIFVSYIYRNWQLDYSKNEVYWTSLVDILDKIKSGFNDNEGDSEARVLNTCYYPRLLVFEFGDIEQENVLYGGHLSPFTNKILQKIVDFRWKYKKRTVFVTRLGSIQKPYEQLIKHYDEATIGRMMQDTRAIKVLGEDRRVVKATQKSIWEV